MSGGGSPWGKQEEGSIFQKRRVAGGICRGRVTRLCLGSEASSPPGLRNLRSSRLFHTVLHVGKVPGSPQTQDKRSEGQCGESGETPCFLPASIKLEPHCGRHSTLWTAVRWGSHHPDLTRIMTFMSAVPSDLSPGSQHLLYPHGPVPTESSEIN